MWAFSDVAPSYDQIVSPLCLDLRIGHLSRNDMQRSFLQFVPGNRPSSQSSIHGRPEYGCQDVHIDTHMALQIIYVHDTARFHVKKVSRNSTSLVTVSLTKIHFFDSQLLNWFLIPKNHQVTTPEGLRAEATQIVHQAAADGYIPCARSMVLDLGRKFRDDWRRYPASVDGQNPWLLPSEKLVKRSKLEVTATTVLLESYLVWILHVILVYMYLLHQVLASALIRCLHTVSA